MSPRKFRILQTEHAGRCLVADAPLPKGTELLRTKAPVLSVITREYRREVCAQCYRYDRGRNLPVKDASTGKAFCSAQHQAAAWGAEAEAEAAGRERKSWEILEAYVKRQAGRRAEVEVEMADADAARPGVAAVERAWEDVRPLGESLRGAREAGVAAVEPHAWSRRHRKAMHEALEARQRVVDPDVLSLLLSGVVLRARSSSSSSGGGGCVATTTEDDAVPSAWTQLLSLAPSATPYANPQTLRAHTHSYLILLALLPPHLLPFVTPETCLAVVTHEVHNSFGLRSLDDAGDEFLGYGVWPEASLFNHSCEPNVAKARGKVGGGRGGRGGGPAQVVGGRRGGDEAEGAAEGQGGDEEEEGDGRTWVFWTNGDVEEREELAISYLGGEEATLDVGERRRRLMSTWGFECRCTKCLREAG